ncbi:MAG TPA: Flp family type IVb pilin [Candidatus Cybelea sp.]|nr:Flp family type IVb pilin [Candidatus Cybelea sp.]
MAAWRERNPLAALGNLLWDERATAALEYGLLLALVALAALVAMQTVGGSVSAVFTHAAPHTSAAASALPVPKR